MARVPNLFNPGTLLSVGTDPFLTLHREMNRLFDDVMRGGAPTTAGQSGGQGAVLLAPSMDVSETDKEARVKVELPGVREDDIEISLNDDVLVIRAEKRQERKEEREGVHFSERAFGTFQRSLRLPFQVDPDQVQARFENRRTHRRSTEDAAAGAEPSHSGAGHSAARQHGANRDSRRPGRRPARLWVG